MALISAPRNEVLRFKSWSASRLDDYDRCPYLAKHKHLLKTCPLCFKGKLKGGFDTPAVCSACGKTPVKGDALVRGGEIGDVLDRYLTGETRTPGKTILHAKVKQIVKKAREEIKAGMGAVQVNLRFTRDWKLIPGDGFDPSAWLYTKLDYRRVSGCIAHVTDWKTGGVDRDGAVKVADKYDDQLLAYQVATLVELPNVEAVTSDLVFLDCKPSYDPVLERDPLTRADLAAAKKKLEKKIVPLMSDTVFAPKASYLCRYCDFAKGKGGPCSF